MQQENQDTIDDTQTKTRQSRTREGKFRSDREVAEASAEERRLQILFKSRVHYGYTTGRILGQTIGNVANGLFNPATLLSETAKFGEKLLGGISDGITTSTLIYRARSLVKGEKKIAWLRAQADKLERDREVETFLTPEQQEAGFSGVPAGTIA